MDIQGPHGVDGVGRVPKMGPTGAPKPPEKPPEAEPVDQVQISLEARLKALLEKVPEVRQDRIDQIRAEIEAGTYETNERIDIAIDRLIEDLTA